MEDLESQIRTAMAADDWQTVAALEPLLDAATRPQIAAVSAALWYAEQGLKVFPLQPGLKLPYKGSSGLKDATSAPRLIQQWWIDRPTSNLAIATGHLVDVIDIDGKQGAQSWAHLKGVPEPLGIVHTPNGRHIYIPATGRGNKAGIAPGIDYRGSGGYVVAPPSTNQTGDTYYWTRPLTLENVRG